MPTCSSMVIFATIESPSSTMSLNVSFPRPPGRHPPDETPRQTPTLPPSRPLFQLVLVIGAQSPIFEFTKSAEKVDWDESCSEKMADDSFGDNWLLSYLAYIGLSRVGERRGLLRTLVRCGVRTASLFEFVVAT